MSESHKKSADLSRGLTIALITPVALLLSLGLVLGGQLVRMTEDNALVDHTYVVLTKAHEVESALLEQTVARRGYLITADPAYLAVLAKNRVELAVTELRAVMSDDKPQQGRVDDFVAAYARWRQAVDPAPESLAKARTLAAMREREHLFGEARRALAAVVDVERGVRETQSAAAARSIFVTKVLFVALILAAAGALAFVSRRQLSAISDAFRSALVSERSTRATLEEKQWLQAAQVKLAERFQGHLSIEELGTRILGTLVPMVDAQIGAFFVLEGSEWRRRAGFGIDARAAGPESFSRGEGLVGEAAKQAKLLRVNDVPAGHMTLRSGVGESEPGQLVLVPASADATVHAVVELGFLRAPADRAIALLELVAEMIALAVRTVEQRDKLRDLLEESQRQSEELQTQQEELRVANEELEEQSSARLDAQARLEERQEELEAINARLEETTRTIGEKSKEVERTSRYKSEFLANMSHELRTPLNSSLILAKLLSENKSGNLTPEQVRFATTIHSAGSELLDLINDVLDLSKVEAGKLDINAEPIEVERVVSSLGRTFEPVALDRKLGFEVHVDTSTPRVMRVDHQRLEQILKNLLSNAFKFTEKGKVSLTVSGEGSQVRFVVRDSGIGIPKEQQELIFEAFRQADGTTIRKYGGTGLGLTISRDLAHHMGGEISVESAAGAGSAFSLTLPAEFSSSEKPAPAKAPRPVSAVEARPSQVGPAPMSDDRERIDADRRLLLIVEDDLRFAEIVRDLATELGFQSLVADNAHDGLALARRHLPHAVVLDMKLPDHSGLTVLDQLKREPATRHIPVHVVSAQDHLRAAMSMGAVGYLSKPVDRDALKAAFQKLDERLSQRTRRVLVVEDDDVQRESIQLLMRGDDVETVAVGTVKEALQAMLAGQFDCVVTDLSLPDASGFELIERIGQDEAYSFPPVIVYTGRSLSADEEQRLRKHSSSIIVKGARSPERLLDEVALFLHQVESRMPAERQKMLAQARDREAVFEGRTILIVEDDVRNIFALSSVLEPRGASVLIARNGKESLDMLAANPGIDVVLMDIMMPVMDGFEAMREIRKNKRYAKLPIIALTAKAMKDDQQRCLDAGANDYVSKPLDVEMLLSLLRVWMPK